MNSFVLDCCTAADWFIYTSDIVPNDYPKAILNLLEQEDSLAIVPYLWHYEFSNALVGIRKRNKIPEAKVRDFISSLKALPIEVESEPINLLSHELTDLAQYYQLTACDAAYLDLALRKGIPLATQDKALIQAMKKAGVPLVQAA